MNKLITTLLALTALASSQALLANVQAVSCHGCSDGAKSQAASNATVQGKVLVFDQNRATVATYQVHTEMLDMRPRTTWTEARLVKTDPTLQKRYEDLVSAVNDVADMGTIYLPGDFEIRSAGGALLDPAFSTTAIEDYMNSVNQWIAMHQASMNIVSRLTQLNFGIIDLKDIIKTLTVKVEFPDGSDVSYQIEFSINPGSSNLRVELETFGNAHGPDGRALPTNALGLRGRTFTNHNGSLAEWMAYARALGALVRGTYNGQQGGVMTCVWTAGRTVCTLKTGK